MIFEKVKEWAKEKGIITNAISKDQFLKTVEEVGELSSALGKADKKEIADAIGDITVTLIILAELEGLDFNNCLFDVYDIISKRNGKMVNGLFVKDCHD